MNNMDKQQTRAVFSRQPARILLVDFSPPLSADTCHLIHQSLEELFAIVCSMAGPPRVPFFGLYALGRHAENLFPLQHMKGNFQRLYNALQELKSYTVEGFAMTEPSDHLGRALKEATSQFQRQAQTLRQMTGFSSQLEVTILTCRSGECVSKQIGEILQEIDLTSLRRIQVASIQYTPSTMMLLDHTVMADDSDNSQSARSEVIRSPSTRSPGSDPLALGAVEVVSLQQDEISLQEFFRGWLHDSGTDREHLHLRLPPTAVGGDWLTLKCDLQERLLGASLLPFQAQFDVHASVVQGKPYTNQPTSKNTASTAPIVTLRAIQMTKIAGICDSIVFGMPLLVRPTSCWKLDWDELESNQQHFHALCHLLHEKNLALVARMEPGDTPQSGYLSPRPSGHFLLLPSPSLSLLLRPVAVRELMLPTDCGRREEQPAPDYLQDVTARLDRLEVDDLYNPLMAKSQLHRCLMGMLVRSAGTRQQPSTGRQTLKRKVPEPTAPSRLYTERGLSAEHYPNSRGGHRSTPRGNARGATRGNRPPSAQRYHQPLTMTTNPYPHNVE